MTDIIATTMTGQTTVLEAAVVTAFDGQFLRASAAENQDLFWALRGGGGNFGVVTEFEFQLHPVGPVVHVGLFFYGLEQGTRRYGSAERSSQPSQRTPT